MNKNGPFYRTTTLLFVLFCIGIFVIISFPSKGSSKSKELSYGKTLLKDKLKHVYQNGHAFLKKAQNQDGSWSNPDFPALTGLVISAFLNSPDYNFNKERPEFIQKGIDFIISNAKDNGAIYKEAMPNYNTAICMMALLSTQDPQYHPYLVKGRRYLSTLQLDKGKKGEQDEIYDGGIGYGTKDHSDMSNTYIALEAIKLTEFLESEQHLDAFKDLEGLQNQRLDWAAALKFIERCQNLPEYNDQAWSSDDPKNKGGFVYFPGNSKAGEEKLSNGKTALRSYGSMTYAGLLSLIFADLKKDDPRIMSAYNWIEQNYTLEENPGMGQQGLYYYYHTMAKALSAMEKNYIKRPEGEMLDWRKALTIRLVEKQRDDGSWINENARWWENDPVLVTSYALISLNYMVPHL